MFLDSIALARTLPCLAEPGKIIVIGKPSRLLLELLAALKDAVNTTWEHWHELVAVTTRRRAPRPLDVWSLLPQTNCKQCGEATCMAFAVGLLQQKRAMAECPPLQTNGDFADRRAALEAML